VLPIRRHRRSRASHPSGDGGKQRHSVIGSKIKGVGQPLPDGVAIGCFSLVHKIASCCECVRLSARVPACLCGPSFYLFVSCRCIRRVEKTQTVCHRGWQFRRRPFDATRWMRRLGQSRMPDNTATDHGTGVLTALPPTAWRRICCLFSGCLKKKKRATILRM
jgi:hypothetical protein